MLGTTLRDVALNTLGALHCLLLSQIFFPAPKDLESRFWSLVHPVANHSDLRTPVAHVWHDFYFIADVRTEDLKGSVTACIIACDDSIGRLGTLYDGFVVDMSTYVEKAEFLTHAWLMIVSASSQIDQMRTAIC